MRTVAVDSATRVYKAQSAGRGDVPVAVDKDTGAILTALSAPTAAAPSNSAPITTTADVTLAAGDRLFIQNLGTNPLFVQRGTGATSSSFNYVLAAGGVADDGTGGSLVIDDFIGAVSFAGTSPRYNAWKA